MLERASVSNSKTEYRAALEQAMADLAADPKVIFMGQAVGFAGTAMTGTLPADLPKERFLELPVTEDMQMGMAIGMSLDGLLPVCIYPRWNFLLLAMSQLVLHLDKLPLYSRFQPKVIIRTAVATPEPLNPGPQHLGDYTRAVETMLRCVKVRELLTPERVRLGYRLAMTEPGSWLLVERTGAYA